MITHNDKYSLLIDESENPVVLVSNYPPVLVPKELFDESKCADYLSLYMTLDDLSKIFHGEIADYVAVFSLKKQDLFLVDQNYRHYDVAHYMAYLYGKLHERETSASSVMVVSFGEDFADFWLEINGKLMIMNRFGFSTPEDFLYMTLNVMSQYNVAFNECQLFLDARTENAAAVELVKQYVANVSSL